MVKRLSCEPNRDANVGGILPVDYRIKPGTGRFLHGNLLWNDELPEKTQGIALDGICEGLNNLSSARGSRGVISGVGVRAIPG